MTEHDQQKAVVEHCDSILQLETRLSVNGHFPIFAVPNAGKRSIPLALWLKAEGLRAGVPDLMLLIKSSGFSGLIIEMKDGKKKPSDEQRAYLDFFATQGFKSVVCYSARHAVETIREYLNG